MREKGSFGSLFFFEIVQNFRSDSDMSNFKFQVANSRLQPPTFDIQHPTFP